MQTIHRSSHPLRFLGVMPALAVLGALACGGDGVTPPGNGGTPVLTSITVTPASATVLETSARQLTASAADQFGNPFSATFTWSSNAVSVATVNQTGLVSAVAVGSATITAMAGSVSGTASVTVEAPSLSAHVQPIFNSNCALSGCHDASSPALGMNLSAGAAYLNTVDVPSVQSSLDRIEPFSTADSYLIHKLQGTQASVGGSGSQMPRNASPLSEATIDMIRAWVRVGAPNN